MNQVEQYLDELKVFVPEFPEYWNSEDAASNFGEESSVYGVFSDFSTLVIEILEAGKLPDAEKLFSYIETVIAEGGQPANAACTCFLENILNHDVEPGSFVSYLGTKSRDFCRGWDEFTGVKTCGL